MQICNHRQNNGSLFYNSRKAYSLLSKLFALPLKRTLQRSLQNTNVMPGFNDAIFDALRMKVSTMHEEDRCVALVFDEMSLKTTLVYNHGLDKIEGLEDFGEWGSSHFLAEHALVFLVWGLLSKWKQPVGYFLTAGTVKSDKLLKLTRNYLDMLEKIGLYTKVVICDQGWNNRNFLQKLERVSVQRPYIVCNNNEVFMIYDPPHLPKDLCNKFMKSNYRYDDVDIKWEYVVDSNNKDKVMSIKMAPKLTDRHITLPPFGARRVNLAAHVLSHSVVAGINELCALKEMADEASTAAEFIETFDGLFIAFNSARLRSNYKYKSALFWE